MDTTSHELSRFRAAWSMGKQPPLWSTGSAEGPCGLPMTRYSFGSFISSHRSWAKLAQHGGHVSPARRESRSTKKGPVLQGPQRLFLLYNSVIVPFFPAKQILKVELWSGWCHVEVTHNPRCHQTWLWMRLPIAGILYPWVYQPNRIFYETLL